MSQEKLVEALTNDAAVRDRFRQNPDQVAEEHGLTLNDDQRQRLTAENWAEHDDATLVEKVTTSPGIACWL